MAKAMEVFRIAELMDMILLKLPNKSLIGAKRTCVAFAETYNNSSNIQYRLFMKTAPWTGYELVKHNDYDPVWQMDPDCPLMPEDIDLQGQKMYLIPLCFPHNDCVWTDEYFRGEWDCMGVWVKLDTRLFESPYTTKESSCWDMMICLPNIPVGDVVSINPPFPQSPRIQILHP